MARFLITPEWKGAKAPGGPGRVVLRVMGTDCVSGKVRRVRVNTEVMGHGESVLVERREEVVWLIRKLYGVIMRRMEAGEAFGVDEVAMDFSCAAQGDVVGGMADADVALRGDVVSVGGGFKGEFRFVFPEVENTSEFLMEYISGLALRAKNEGKDSRVRTLGSVRRSLSRFLDGEDVRLQDVDRVFVRDYSEWLGEEGVSESTQSFYLRSLRLVLNQAKEAGVFRNCENLFEGLNTRVIFKGEEKEIGVGREVMWRIANMDLSEDEELRVVRDMFMFAFYCKGMELRDVMSLTRGAVHDGMLTYRRRGNGRMKSVILDENATAIIERYPGGEGDFLFPLIGMHRGLRQYSINGIVRRCMRRIGEMAGEPELTFGMNIATWQGLVSQIDPAVMLRGSA